MEDSARVQRLHGGEQRHEEANAGALVERRHCVTRCEWHAFDELHRDVRPPVVRDADLERAHDARVVDRRHGARLGLEAAEALVVERVTPDELDCHRARQAPDLPRPPDLGHRAAPEE